MIRILFITFYGSQALLILALSIVSSEFAIELGLLVTAVVLQIKMPDNYKFIIGFYMAYNTLLLGHFYWLYLIWHQWIPLLLPAVNYIVISFYFIYYYNNFIKIKKNIVRIDDLIDKKDEVAPNNKV